METTDVIGTAAVVDNQEPQLEPAPFRVLGDNIVLEFVEREEETVSGIVLVQEKQERVPEATVVGIGPAAADHFEINEGVVVELGTVLMLRKHELSALKLGEDGRELYVAKPHVVLGIVG
jgi:co-chaperonin GroES (HSP10)